MNITKGHQNHEKMKVWQSADQLDTLIQKLLKKIPRSEYKLREQIDSASDSIGSNFVEGYYAGSIAEYIRFCKYARRSCGELQERIRRLFRKNYIGSDELAIVNRRIILTGYLFDRLIHALQIKTGK